MNSPARTDSVAVKVQAGLSALWPFVYLTVASGALAASIYGQSNDLWDAVTSFVVVWVVAGLAIQAAEILQSLRSETSFSGDQRAAWRFAACWRVAIAVTLPMYYLQRDAEQLLTAADGAPQAPFAAKLQFVLFAISLVTALSSNGRLSVAAARQGWRKSAGETFTWVAVVGLTSFVVCQAVIPWVVERAITVALDVMEPADTLGNDEKLALRQSQFVAHSLVAASAGLSLIFLARRFGQARQVTAKHGAMFAALTIAAIGVAASALYWLLNEGGTLATNAFANAEQSWFGGTWRGLSGLLIFATTTLACRFTITPSTSNSPIESIDLPTTAAGWRRHPQHYYHESRWIAALLFVASLGQLEAMVSYLFGFFRTRATDWSTVIERCGLVLAECVTQPAFLLLVTISLVALRGMIGRRVPEQQANQATIRGLSERRFAIVWLTLLVALAVEAAALAWVGFSLWHASWQVPLPIDA